MGYMAIVWNGNTFTMTRHVQGFVPKMVTDTATVTAASGYDSYLHSARRQAFRVLLEMLTETEEQALTNFWYWASQGNEFAIARDSTQDTATTLDGSTSGTTVPLTATTGITAGDYLLLISADRVTWERVTVQSVSAGVSVTTTSAVLNSFVSGDTCRHFFYLPYAHLEKVEDLPVNVEGEGRTNTRKFTMDVIESVQE